LQHALYSTSLILAVPKLLYSVLNVTLNATVGGI